MSYFSEIYGDPELSAKAKLVLLYLHDRANRDGESWYAIGTMAKDLSLSRSTIKRALADPPGPGGEAYAVSRERWVYFELLSNTVNWNLYPKMGKTFQV